MSWRCRNVSGSSVLLIYKCFIARVKLHDVFKLGTMMIPVWLFLFRIGLFILSGFLFSSLSSQLLSSPHLTSFPSPPFPYPLLPSFTLLSPLLSFSLPFSEEFHWHSNGHCTVLRSFLNNKGTLTLFFKPMSERSCHVLVYFSVSSLLLNFANFSSPTSFFVHSISIHFRFCWRNCMEHWCLGFYSGIAQHFAFCNSYSYCVLLLQSESLY